VHHCRKFTDIEEEQIKKEYESGISSTDLAVQYDCDVGTIIRAVNRQCGKIRTYAEASRLFTRSETNEVRKIYESGFSSTQIAGAYGCDHTTVLDAVRRGGGIVREQANPEKLSVSRQFEILKRYEQGDSSLHLGRVFNCSTTTILNIVRRLDGQVRNNRKFSDIVEQQIFKRYESGETSNKLASVYGCSSGVILRAIKRQGGQTRESQFQPGEQHPNWKGGDSKAKRRELEREAFIKPIDSNEVFAADDYACAYCGLRGDLTIDHIAPLNKGGKHCWTNVTTACRKCNSSKGDALLLAWLCDVWGRDCKRKTDEIYQSPL